MATKKTETGKKETASTKKTTPNAKKAIEAPDLETMPEEIQTLAASHEPKVIALPHSLMSKIMEDVTALMDSFQHFTDNNLTIAQRRRKIGAGIRNYGLIEKVAFKSISQSSQRHREHGERRVV